jgi:biotin carboxylase
MMVLGTNAGQADLIAHMKGRGWRVIGVSPVAGEPGQALCDLWLPLNILDLDALAAAVAEHHVDVVWSISSDVAIRAATALSERLGLPHFGDMAFIRLLDDKAALRAFLNDRNLSPVPFARVTDPGDVGAWTHFPCIVKPADAQGQRGVVRLDGPAGLAQAVAEALPMSHSRTAIVEGFLDGIEVSCNVMLSDGVTRLRVLSERLVHQGIAVGLPRGHLIPAVHVPPAARADALAQVDRIIAAFGADCGFRDGVLYFQMIMTPDGPRVVEIAPRLDGCHMWRLIRATQGVDLIGMAVDALTGEGAVASHQARDDIPAQELMFQQMPPGGPFDPAAFPVPEDASHHEYRYRPGETVRPVNGRLEVVGYYVRPMDA